MENTSNLRTLAETAFESKNYDQAYQYYTRLLETDPSDGHAWLGKGLSAGWASTPPDPKFDEMMVSVRQAFKNGVAEPEKEAAADQVIAASEHYIRQAEVAFDEGVREFNKKEMAPGVLLAVHNLGKMEYQIESGKKQSPGFAKALEAMAFGYDLAPSTERGKRVVRQIDQRFQSSKQNMNYMGGPENPASPYPALSQLRSRIVQSVKSADPTYSPQAPPAVKSGGCFIATATYGDYNHPAVLELRHFRDDALLSHSLGRAFVQTYYKLSPPLADFIRVRPRARAIAFKLVVRPALWVARKSCSSPSAT